MLGSRSAVFAPVPQLGLIVVDEEHEPSYKQHEGSCAITARDVAVVRAQRRRPGRARECHARLEILPTPPWQVHAPVPAAASRSQALPPRLALVDLRTSASEAGASTQPTCPIERHVRDDGQVLVFLNRRGNPADTQCTSCGRIAHLPRLRCRAHGPPVRRTTCAVTTARADAPLPWRCPVCGLLSRLWARARSASRRSCAALSRAARIARLDRDVVRKRDDSTRWCAASRASHDARRHADGDQGARFSEHDARGGPQRRPATFQHRLSRARARCAASCRWRGAPDAAAGSVKC